MIRFRIRWLSTAHTKPSPAWSALPYRPCSARSPRWSKRPRASDRNQCLRHDGWRAFLHDAPFGRGLGRIELAFEAIARDNAADPWPSARTASGPGYRARSFQDTSRRGQTIPNCPVRGRSRTTRPVSDRAMAPFAPPRVPRRKLDSTACRCRKTDLLARKNDPSPAHSPTYRSPATRLSEKNKTTRGALLRTSSISAGSCPLKVEDGQGSAPPRWVHALNRGSAVDNRTDRRPD